MIRRNGGTSKVVAGVIAFFGFVYFIYLYNDLSGQLKNTENSAARYRRDAESASAQLQDMILAKNELQQKYDNEKEQMTNRLNSQQQQFKMLKSQHEDMESEFGRLQNEKEKEVEDHKKQDDERAIEYNQFKQEKMLEISSLKDSVANLEREKEQLTQQISELKQQIQNSLQQLQTDRQTIIRNQGLLNYAQDLVQQAQTRQQQIEQQYQQLQQQVAAAQQSVGQQQQQQQQQVQQQQGINNFQGRGQQMVGDIQPGGQQGLNVPVGGDGLAVKNMQQDLKQQGGGVGLFGAPLQQNVQKVMQGLKEQFPHEDNVLGNLIHGADKLHQNLLNQQAQPIVGNNVHQDDKNNPQNFNIADDILKSLQEKHKPVDADILEEQQKQHQIIPPRDPDNVDDDNGQQKLAQNMLGQDGHGLQNQDPQQHQINRPDFNADNVVHSEDKTSGPVAGDHDNRIENQGPVNLQVQEPNMRAHDDSKDKFPEGGLKFRPHVPLPLDNQIQPQAGADDTRREEQMDIPIGREKNMADNLPGRNDYNEEDDEKYDDDYDKDDDDDEY